MKTYTCKLAGIDNPKVWELSYDEMANMSIQYPMFMLVDGKWKGILHSKNGIYV